MIKIEIKVSKILSIHFHQTDYSLMIKNQFSSLNSKIFLPMYTFHHYQSNYYLNLKYLDLITFQKTSLKILVLNSIYPFQSISESVYFDIYLILALKNFKFFKIVGK